MNSQVRVILVEDDQVLRESLRDYLTLTGCQVDAVESGIGFYHLLSRQTYDVAVIDIGLPDQSGYVLTEYARANTGMGLVIITAHDSLEARISGYQAGSDLFLAKPVDGRELVAAITSIASRCKERNRQETTAAPRWGLSATRWILTTPSGINVALTAKEYQVLCLLVEAAGETVERDTLTCRLYGNSSESSSRSLDTLVGRLRKKLAAQSPAEELPVMSVYGRGYRMSASCAID